MKWQIRGMGEAVAEKFPLFPLSRPAPAQPTSMLFPLMSTILEDSISFRYHSWMNCGSFELHMIFLSWCRLNFAELRKHERRHFPISHDTEFFLPHPSLFFPKTSLFISVFILPNNSLTMSKDYFSCFVMLFLPPPRPAINYSQCGHSLFFVVFIFSFSPPPSPSSWGPAINWSQCGLW